MAGARSSIALQSHMLALERDGPDSTGSLSWISSALSISAKIIAAKRIRARVEDVLGEVGSENVRGEAQHKLDVLDVAPPELHQHIPVALGIPRTVRDPLACL